MHTRLFKKCVMSMLVIIMFLVSVPSSGGAPLDIETVFPEYILDGNITIEGTATGIPYRLEDNTTAVFSIGTLQDVYAENDAVILKPRLTLSALNGGNPVLTSDIKQDDLDHHCVVKVSKTYYMYYFTGDYSSGRSSYLRLATSSDGETWTNHTSNPILTFNNTTTDVQMGSSPYVYEESGTFHLFYSISNNSVMEINYANSTDGVNCSLYASNPVLRPGPSGSYDDQRLRAGSIVKLGNTYNLYYYGSKKVDQKWSLLLANSTDMLTWTKSTSNPLTVASDWWFSSMEQATASNRFWYTRSTNSIGYIWSENGLDWYDAGVLFMSQPGTFYSSAISTPWVFANGTDYLMIWAPGRWVRSRSQSPRPQDTTTPG